MDCSFCPGNSATCHLTKIVNGNAVEIHVCEKCIPEIGDSALEEFDVWEAVTKLAKEKGKPDPCQAIETEKEEISVKSLLIPSSPAVPKEVCPSCGFTSDDVRKTGRMGCPSCYDIFIGMLQDVIRDCQKGPVHEGKIPSKEAHLHLERLEQALDLAVSEERFEDAALLRDKLKSIQE